MNFSNVDDFLNDAISRDSVESDIEWSSIGSDSDCDAEATVGLSVATSVPQIEQPVVSQGLSSFISMCGVQQDSLGKRKRDFEDGPQLTDKKMSFWYPSVMPLNPLVTALLPRVESYELSLVAGDGNCFFSSVSLALADHQQLAMSAQALRALAVSYLYDHIEHYAPFFDEQESLLGYCEVMRLEGSWADSRVIQALVDALQIRVEIVDTVGQYQSKPMLYVLESSISGQSRTTIRLQRSGSVGREHYDAITPVNSNHSAQSILR